jgi:hypothetical protein
MLIVGCNERFVKLFRLARGEKRSIGDNSWSGLKKRNEDKIKLRFKDNEVLVKTDQICLPK